MIQKLVILGLLKNKPSSGYDIKKFIEKDLKIFTDLDTHSIYYPLKKME
ncbi:MAG: PadR family transcriptional regulator, partial [Candidatus Omnitrophota bacterium]